MLQLHIGGIELHHGLTKFNSNRVKQLKSILYIGLHLRKVITVSSASSSPSPFNSFPLLQRADVLHRAIKVSVSVSI